ncbi:hypothetical protein GCM10023187_49960 [Nibrella viscosa]|uniref:Uncharacterized protein n=1 Tax=Nibrella viscosa TaxID=1084524 RepID=A0ABP8KWJ3_9BACT
MSGGPWNSVTCRNGYFYIAEGGETAGDTIVRVSRNGERRVLIANLPTMGDHHTNGPVIGNDNYLYFSTAPPPTVA